MPDNVSVFTANLSNRNLFALRARLGKFILDSDFGQSSGRFILRQELASVVEITETYGYKALESAACSVGFRGRIDFSPINQNEVSVEFESAAALSAMHKQLGKEAHMTEALNAMQVTMEQRFKARDRSVIQVG